jgi:antitoxin CptB
VADRYFSKMDENLNNKRKRLIFRSEHRGTKEMDLIMGSFAKAHVPGFGDGELAEYEALLSLSDPDLYNWITGQEPVPANIDGDLFRKLRAHKLA